MHEYYWENYTEMDQYGYENFDNQQALFNQMTANEDSIHLLKRYRRMVDSPFFGRVDFRYEDEENPEIFYIEDRQRIEGTCVEELAARYFPAAQTPEILEYVKKHASSEGDMLFIERVQKMAVLGWDPGLIDPSLIPFES